MKRRNTILICLFSCLMQFGTLKTSAQTFNQNLANMLQDTLDTYVSQITNIKGMSASVYIPGQGVWTGVSGISHAGQQITPDMKFGIASNSKLFASVIMLKLAENNIISLDDSIKDWVTISNPNINSNVTIRQLLNHTSGISDPFFAAPWMDTILANPTRVFTPDEVMDWIGAPLFPAGTSYGYSNTNYIIAGMIAQSASGYSLAALIRDSILTPLNMDSTFIDVEEPVIGTLAHRWWNRAVNPVTEDYHDTSRVGLNSAVGYAGSIFSTSSEMVQWYNALFAGQIINQSSMNELTSFIATSNPNYQYGLGLSRDVTQGLKYWGHGGRTWGYKSKMMYDTCLHVSVAGLANADPSGVDAVTFLLYRAVKNHIPGCNGSIIGSPTVCKGENSVTYTTSAITNATSYIWTLPAGATGTSNTNSITVNFGSNAVSGDITVRGNNQYGDGATSVFPVTVKIVPTGVTQNLNTLTADSSASSYQWIDCNSDYLPLMGETGQSLTPSVNGNYAVVISKYGCTDTSACIPFILTGISDASMTTTSVYPNPSSGIVNFRTDKMIRKIIITNLLGQAITEMSPASNVAEFYIGNPGIYYYTVVTEGDMYTKGRIVVN